MLPPGATLADTRVFSLRGPARCCTPGPGRQLACHIMPTSVTCSRWHAGCKHALASRPTPGDLSPVSQVLRVQEQGACMGLRDQWYENAIFYCLDVETYADSDGDGVGDFRGLTRRLDYLAGLGVTCLWLMPFYPTPNRDDGYDVADFCAVDPRLGSTADFSEFMVETQ